MAGAKRVADGVTPPGVRPLQRGVSRQIAYVRSSIWATTTLHERAQTIGPLPPQVREFRELLGRAAGDSQGCALGVCCRSDPKLQTTQDHPSGFAPKQCWRPMDQSPPP